MKAITSTSCASSIWPAFLCALPNVVLSPHNAGQTAEVIRDGLLRAVENVENFLKGRPTDVVVQPVGRKR